MPTYEYECRSCHHTFESFQSMLEKPLRKCPECGGRLKRQIGAGAGILFRGSGFYATDYRSAEYRSREKAEKGSKEGTEGSDSSGKKKDD